MNRNRQILALVVFATIIFLYQYVYQPNARRVRSDSALLIQKQKDFDALTDLISKHKASAAAKSTERVPQDFTLFSFVADRLEKRFSRDQITRISPVATHSDSPAIQETIAVTLEDVKLDQLLGFLQEVESRPYLFFTSFQITRNTIKPYLVRAEMEIACSSP
jgi:type II secretory pathway component PulM